MRRRRMWTKKSYVLSRGIRNVHAPLTVRIQFHNSVRDGIPPLRLQGSSQRGCIPFLNMWIESLEAMSIGKLFKIFQKS
jgi:hypothetical protein